MIFYVKEKHEISQSNILNTHFFCHSVQLEVFISANVKIERKNKIIYVYI